MKSMKVALLATLVSCAVFASADAVGKYSGGIVFTVGGKEMPSNPQMGGNLKFNLELKKDKTYTTSQTGGPKESGASGTYKIEGNKVLMTPKMRDGKPAAGEGAKVRTYAYDEKTGTLTLDITEQVKANMKGAPEGTKVYIRLKKSK